MNSKAVMQEITRKAKEAARELALMDEDAKNRVLLSIAEGINAERDTIKKANEEDIASARKKGKNEAFIDRLTLSDKRIDGMCDMMRQVATLPDPVGHILESIRRPNGLVIDKVRVPIGVIGIIYESRPNVTADCAALCLKSGNSVILRGGSDSINSNKAIYEVMKKSALKEGLAEGAFILIEDTSRELVDAMLEATDGIDLVMPRGGESLIEQVVEKSRIPVIKHYKGVCHVYVDADADLKMAEEICFNAKVQRPGVCNAMETMLVHEKVATKFLPVMIKRFRDAGVKMKGCDKTRAIIDGVEKVTDEDFYTEWLDLVLSIRIVSSVEEAALHIAKYGSTHSDAIVTKNEKTGEEFLKKVDSSAVYLNASTRFTDGGEFGKGAEIGISTDRIHARGPMGLEELCTYKYIVRGDGQVRT